ncbi:MAG: hypothetical protein WA740_00300 [Candidatus Binataceae bacterium]
MPLTDAQIERYSRQIIVPHFGSRAQERLLGARIVFAARREDLDPPLAYLVGAGVGGIYLDYDTARVNININELAAAMRALNPDSVVAAFASDDCSRVAPDLCVAIIGDAASLSSARALCANLAHVPSLVARLDSPAQIGIFPAPPPCAICSNSILAKPFGQRSPDAGLIAMAATAEAFKLLAGYDAAPRAALIEFHGYDSRVHQPTRDLNCACASAA